MNQVGVSRIDYVTGYFSGIVEDAHFAMQLFFNYFPAAYQVEPKIEKVWRF
jgi:hypothetical protein